MQTTYRLNTHELSMAFIESLKSLLPNQEIEIVVSMLPKSERIENTAWLQAVADSPSFRFLHDEAEDIYTLADGQPVQTVGN